MLLVEDFLCPCAIMSLSMMPASMPLAGSGRGQFPGCRAAWAASSRRGRGAGGGGGRTQLLLGLRHSNTNHASLSRRSWAFIETLSTCGRLLRLIHILHMVFYTMISSFLFLCLSPPSTSRRGGEPSARRRQQEAKSPTVGVVVYLDLPRLPSLEEELHTSPDNRH